jgi:hypothetical protein
MSPEEARVRAALEKNVIICFAGPIAQRRATECDEPGCKILLSRERAVAFHEAGHGVASLALGWGCYELSIVPEPVILRSSAERRGT